MNNRQVVEKKKGDTQIREIKFVVGCTLIGSVVTGALFGWVQIPFDIRLIGAGVGAIAGIAASHVA